MAEDFNPPPPEEGGPQQQSGAPAKVTVSRLFFPERMGALERGAQLQRYRALLSESMALSGYPPEAVNAFGAVFDKAPFGSQEWEQGVSEWIEFL